MFQKTHTTHQEVRIQQRVEGIVCGLIGRPRVVFRKQRVAGVAVGLRRRRRRRTVRDERYRGGYQCDDYNAAAAPPPFVLRAHLLGFGLLGVALAFFSFNNFGQVRVRRRGGLR